MNGNVQDTSGNNRNGAFVGATTTTAATYVSGLAGLGQAIRLNGSNEAVNLADLAAWDPAGSFSFSVWVNAVAWTGNNGSAIIANRGGDNVGWALNRAGNTNQIRFMTFGAGGDNLDSGATNLMVLGNWTHITCVFDSVNRTKTMYINGGQVSQVATTGVAITAPPTTATINTYIGARASAIHRHY